MPAFYNILYKRFISKLFCLRIYNCATGFSRLLYDISETKIFVQRNKRLHYFFISSRLYIICIHAMPEVRCYIILHIHPFLQTEPLNFNHFYINRITLNKIFIIFQIYC